MKILVAEDNQDSRMILQKTLGHEGHTVEVAINGEDALEKARANEPDLIISDILMPVMDGFKFCHAVKHDKQLRKIPFIFYTATYVDLSDERLAIALGASRYIIKPIENEEFIKIINEVLQEVQQDQLPIPEEPSEDLPHLFQMYDKSISQKLQKKVRELELYRKIFANSKDAIVVIDPDGFYIEQNPAHQTLLGFSDEELRGKPLAIYLGDETSTVIMTELSDKRFFRGEVTSRTKAGVRLDIDLLAFLIGDEQGTVASYVGIERDITERKQDENEIIKSREEVRLERNNFRNILNSMDDGVYIGNSQHDIEYVNPILKKEFGEVKGRKCFEYFHDLSAECPWCPNKEVFQGKTVRWQWYSHKNQRTYDLLDTPLKNYDGSLSKLEIFRDITEIKQVEQTLTNQKQYLETIVNAIPGIICLKDGEGRWLLANNYDLDLFQLDGVDYIGKTDAELAPYSDFYRDAFLTCMDSDNEAWEAKEVSRCEETIPKSDGSSLIFDIAKIPLFNPDGSRQALVVVGHDVTERKRHEAAIVRSKEEWEKTFDAIPDIITLQDKDMRIVRANKAAYDFFEMKYGDLFGKKCHKIFRGTSEPCPGCPGLIVVKDLNCHSGIIEHEGLGKTFHVTTSPILNKNNEVQYIAHIAKDITEQKKLEEELFQAHKMEAIGTLAGGIAHDFNNILSAILSYSILAQKDLPAGSEAGKDIDQVITAGKRAADLVKQILSFSRKTGYKLNPLAPHLVVKEALKMMRATLPTTIVMQEDIDPECGTILADPTGLHQIIVNLCTNALHAMEDQKGTLSVSLHRQEIRENQTVGGVELSAGPFIVLSVSDSGCGMEQETIDRIFEPYFTTKEIGKGTGMGLAAIHGLVLDYKGAIKVQSTLGQGSTFNVYLPVLHEEISVLENLISEKTDASLPTGKERILVVDDESVLVRAHKRQLTRLGYKVTGTTDSKDALEKIRIHPEEFDLLITDQTMPGLSGVELAKEVQKIKPDMPIILCTGHSDVVSKEDALAIGIKKYVSKPIYREELSQAIREVLDEK